MIARPTDAAALSVAMSLVEFNRSVVKLREWSENVEQGKGTDPVHYRSGLRVRRVLSSIVLTAAYSSGLLVQCPAPWGICPQPPYSNPPQLREEKARHRRLMDDPQTYIRSPVTGSQARLRVSCEAPLICGDARACGRCDTTLMCRTVSRSAHGTEACALLVWGCRRSGGPREWHRWPWPPHSTL